MQSWTDDFLVWDPIEWGNIARLTVPASNLWLPDGQIFNSVEVKEPFPVNARISHTGLVEVDFNKVFPSNNHVQLVDVRCPLDVLSFPFDDQLCALQFGSWSYQKHQLTHYIQKTFIPGDSDVHTTEMSSSAQESSEWKLISFDAEKIVRNYSSNAGDALSYEEIFYRLVNFSLKKFPENSSQAPVLRRCSAPAYLCDCQRLHCWSLHTAWLQR